MESIQAAAVAKVTERWHEVGTVSSLPCSIVCIGPLLATPRDKRFIVTLLSYDHL